MLARLTRLLQIVTFTNVPAASTITLPHDLNISGASVVPDFIAGDVGGFTITADATTISVTNNGSAPASVDVWLERVHSIPRELGGAILNMAPQPFVAAAGGGGSSGGVIVEDEGTPILSPATALNFVGPGVTATDGGGGTAIITVPGGIAGLTFEDEGTPIAGNPHTVVNFVGAGVTATDAGGVATVTVPGSSLASLGIQSYRYAALGTEDPTGFPILLQTPRADANYNAVAALGITSDGSGGVGGYTTQCPPANYTNTQFTCIPGAQPLIGDVLLITITPLT
jgi:hypothetical protein